MKESTATSTGASDGPSRRQSRLAPGRILTNHIVLLAAEYRLLFLGKSGACLQRQSKMRVCISRGTVMRRRVRELWSDDTGQDSAEYAVMLAVILVLVVGTIGLVGSNSVPFSRAWLAL